MGKMEWAASEKVTAHQQATWPLEAELEKFAIIPYIEYTSRVSGDFVSRLICQVDQAKSTPVDLSYTSLHNLTPHLVFCNCWDVFFSVVF